MLKFKNIKNIPKLYPKVVRQDPTISSPGFVKVGDFTLRQNIDLIPQRGMQENAAASDCNLIFLGGSGTSGKTFIGLMMATRGLGYPNYTARIVTKLSKDGKIGTSLKRDFEHIYGNFANCSLSTSDGLTAEWGGGWNNAIKSMHSNFNEDNPTEWEAYKDHCKANTALFYYFDEVTGLRTWRKFAYNFSRNRDASRAMAPTTVVSFNPEPEHWTTSFLERAGYLTKDYYFPAEKNGVITYFYSGEGDEVDDIVFGASRKEVAEKANIKLSKKEIDFGMKPEDMVKSFTCFIGSPIDNKILAFATKGASIANLAAVGKTEGTKMYLGYFGPTMSHATKVTPAIIDNIFKSPVSSPDEQHYSTLDVSAGGDLTIQWFWRGKTLVGREDITSDNPTKLEEWVSHNLAKWNVPVTNFAYDSGGMGFFLKKFRDGYAITSNTRPIQEIDTFGNPTSAHQAYYDVRSQLMSKFEAMLLMGEISSEIPPETLFLHTKKRILRPFRDILVVERNLFIWQKINNKIKAVTKTYFKTRYKYSPDAMDSLWFFAIFFIDMKPKKEKVLRFSAKDYYMGINGV